MKDFYADFIKSFTKELAVDFDTIIDKIIQVLIIMNKSKEKTVNKSEGDDRLRRWRSTILLVQLALGNESSVLLIIGIGGEIRRA